MLWGVAGTLSKKCASMEIQVDSIDGRNIRLSDLKGKVVLLNFWATWCAPCIKEMPLLVRTYERYKDNGFEVIAVSVVFFFQAEDGIRDVAVTGVQTCALPISRRKTCSRNHKYGGTSGCPIRWNGKQPGKSKTVGKRNQLPKRGS